MKPVTSLRVPLWLSLGSLATLILFQQFVELPRTSMLMLAFNNAAHTPFFAILTLLLWQVHPFIPRRFQPRQKLLLLLGAMLVVATLTELAQALTIRDPSFEDWLRNLLGIGAGFCCILLWQWRRHNPWTRQVMLAALGLLFMALGFRGVVSVMERYQQRAAAMPHLLIMESDYLARMSRRSGSWQLGQKGEFQADAGRMTATDPQRDALLLSLDRGSYPGITLREPYPDWRWHQSLVIEAENLDAAPLNLTVRVETTRDRGMKRAREFTLPPEPTLLRIPLDQLIEGKAEERPDIRNLLLFVDGEREGKGLLIYDIRLE